MIIEVNSKQDEYELEALRFVDEGMNLFSDRLASASHRLPSMMVDGERKTSVKDRTILLNVFLDALMGMTAMIAASYCNDMSSQFEDKLATEFRRKFFEMRKRSMGIEAEMRELPIKPKEELT